MTAQGRGDDFIGAKIIYTTVRTKTCEELEPYLEDCLKLKLEYPDLIAGTLRTILLLVQLVSSMSDNNPMPKDLTSLGMRMFSSPSFTMPNHSCASRSVWMIWDLIYRSSSTLVRHLETVPKQITICTMPFCLEQDGLDMG